MRNEPLLPSSARQRALFFVMPNIRQQKKRVRTAGREHAENIRYRSTVRTLTDASATAVENGDQDEVQTSHRELVRMIDKATVSKGALHRNTAGRRKAQAAKLVSGVAS